MIRSKVGLLGLCAMVLGVMAISAASAQAHLFEWLILNAAETSASELLANLVGEVETTPRLLVHLVGLSVEISCTGFNLEGVHLELGGQLTESGKVRFTGCEAYDLQGGGLVALGCEIHTAGQAAGTVLTDEVKGGLLLHEYATNQTEIVAHIEPKTGNTFATFLANDCALPESTPIHGVIYLKDCGLMIELHLVRHLIEELSSLTELWVGADNEEHLLTSIDGSSWVKLGAIPNGADHTGLKWGAKHNLP